MSTHFSVFDLLETVDRLQTRREIGKVDFVKLLSDQLCQLSITLGRKQAWSFFCYTSVDLLNSLEELWQPKNYEHLGGPDS